MTREEVREKFKKVRLEYNKIKQGDIERLVALLQLELAIYLVNGGDHARQMRMEVSKRKAKDVVFSKSGLKEAYIKIDGSYFEGREGISFNRSGFIGFGGEFSDVNVQPILLAFDKWCDELSKES